MDNIISVDTLRDHLPSYLTDASQQKLIAALKDFQNVRYFTNNGTDVLQGDGWTSLSIINFDTLEKKNIFGMLLSNSCDMDPSNGRYVPRRICFSPLIKLANFKEKLSSFGVSTAQIETLVNDLKSQKILNCFYLPDQHPLTEEHLVAFDDVHSLPPSLFIDNMDKKNIFSLSGVGFYLFILKLSIHFCRLHERVNRD